MTAQRAAPGAKTSSKRSSAPRTRRALSHVGGPTQQRGDDSWAAALAECLRVRRSAEPLRWTHGFHTYPARMHPETAERLVQLVSAPGSTVLDPFCGSGTVLLEALLAGRAAVGRDLNPLAVRLAALRCRCTSETERRALRDTAGRVCSRALRAARDEVEPPAGCQPLLRPRVPAPNARTVPVAPWHGEDAALFSPKVLLELAWTTFEIGRVDDPFVRDALALVLSSILVKLSRRASDTSELLLEDDAPLMSPALALRERAHELSRQLKLVSAALRGRATRGSHNERSATQRAAVDLDDARTLKTLADDSIDAVVTSPPYPSVYDYVEHHRLRSRWLGLDDSPLDQHEIGSRRSFADPRVGYERWERDGQAWVTAIARALRPGGYLAVLGGDGASSLGAIHFDKGFESWARAAGLRLVAAASQQRPSFDRHNRDAYGRGTRREHLLLAQRPA